MDQTQSKVERAPTQDGWLVLFRRYLMWTAGANLLWEVAHLPLYTVWETGTSSAIAWLLVRCTVGDLLIALSSLMLALILLNRGDWPAQAYWRSRASRSF